MPSRELIGWLAIFGVAVFSAVFFIVDVIMRGIGPAGLNLEVRATEKTETLELLSPLASMFRPVAMIRLQWMSSAQIAELNRNIVHAGLRQDMAIEDFLALQCLGAVGGILAGFLMALTGLGFNATGVGAMLGLAMIGWVFPTQWLKGQAVTRQEKIFRGLSTTLDTLSICVQAGLEVRRALARVSRMGTEAELDREIGKTLQEVEQGGRPVNEALDDLQERVGLRELSAFCDVLALAFRLGASGVAQILVEQAESIRNERIIKAEEKVSKMGSKILLPVTLFIFPAVLVSLLGPWVLRAYLDFGR